MPNQPWEQHEIKGLYPRKQTRAEEATVAARGRAEDENLLKSTRTTERRIESKVGGAFRVSSGTESLRWKGRRGLSVGGNR